jgi:hypothetical protein
MGWLMAGAKKVDTSIFRKPTNVIKLRRRTWLSPYWSPHLSAFSLLFPSRTPQKARGVAALQLELRRLESATNIILMIIPRFTSFRGRVGKKDLPHVSCVYQINRPESGSSYADVQAILQQNIVEFRKKDKEALSEDSEVRIGIFFRNGEQVLRAFYFEDGYGRYDINGVAGEYWIRAYARTPDRLRALAARQDVILIESNHFKCPHS